MLLQEKVNQAIGLLKEYDVDCWITFVRETQINGDPTLAFLVTEDLTWHSAFIFLKSGETCAIVGKYDKQTVEDIQAYETVIGFVTGIKEPLLDYLRNKKPDKIAINYSTGSEICDGLTYGMYLTLHQYLSEINYQQKLISSENIVSALRQRKTATEIKYIREAIRHTEEIFIQVHPFIKPGKTEHEVAAFMKDKVELKQLEFAWNPAGCPAVFSGPDTAEAHYAPTERTIQPGHILNMDFGVKYQSYCSDLQRTFYIQRPGETHTPTEVQKGFDTIVAAIESAKQAMKPGVLGHEIDAIAREIVINAGFEEFPHGLGHQVGRFSHDGTALLGPAWEKYAQKPFFPLEEGMVFTLEPRLTVPEYGIATVEEMVLVTKNGAEYLSTPQKELLRISG
jgi:Xaa-Pro aminopeptidase